MKYKNLLAAAACVVGSFAALPASASTVLFELSGSRNATFTIDTTATPDFLSSSAFGDQMSFNDVAGTYGGSAGTAQIGFGNNIFAELNIGGTSLGFTQFAGPDFFSLMGSKPVFKSGTYALTSIVSGASTLRVSDVGAVGAVPEPGVWAMMIAGFGLISFSMRRRRKDVITLTYS